MSDLIFARKVEVLAAQMEAAGLPYAMGGALALGYCVPNPRATADIDINVFVETDRLDDLIAALPADLTVSDEGISRLRRDAQARMFWGDTPVDFFMTNVDFHTEAAGRVQVEDWNGQPVRFLACRDLAVFKSFFDRDKDWVDMGEMLRRGSIDVDWVLGTLVRHLGGADHRVERLRSLAARVAAEGPQEWRG